MTRNAFKMKLKPGVVAELKAAGVSDYSIFLDEETLTLLAVQKLGDGNTAAQLPNSPIVRKWRTYMAPPMETHPDYSPVAKPLNEVFHLD